MQNLDQNDRQKDDEEEPMTTKHSHQKHQQHRRQSSGAFRQHSFNYRTTGYSTSRRERGETPRDNFAQNLIMIRNESEIGGRNQVETEEDRQQMERQAQMAEMLQKIKDKKAYSEFISYEESNRRKTQEDQILSPSRNVQKKMKKDYSQGRLLTSRHGRESTTDLGYQTARIGLQNSQSQTAFGIPVNSQIQQKLNIADSFATLDNSTQRGFYTNRQEKILESLKSARGKQSKEHHSYRVQSKANNINTIKQQINNKQVEQRRMSTVLQDQFEKRYEETKTQFDWEMKITKSIPKFLKCADRVLNKNFDQNNSNRERGRQLQLFQIMNANNDQDLLLTTEGQEEEEDSSLQEPSQNQEQKEYESQTFITDKIPPKTNVGKELNKDLVLDEEVKEEVITVQREPITMIKSQSRKQQEEQFKYGDLKFYRNEAKYYFFDLELFDEDAKDDPDPIQLINDHPGGLNGFSKYTNSKENRTYWRKCKILGYDPIAKTFTISFSEDDKQSSLQKQVKRLNLVYEFEDIQTFEQRIAMAQNRRKIHDCLVRYSWNLMKSSEDMQNQDQQQHILIRKSMIESVLRQQNINNKDQLDKNTIIQLKEMTKNFLNFYRQTVFKHTFDLENIEKQSQLAQIRYSPEYDIQKMGMAKLKRKALKLQQNIVFGQKQKQKDSRQNSRTGQRRNSAGNHQQQPEAINFNSHLYTLMLVIETKIIRYIKSISEITFFKGLHHLHERKTPLTIKKIREFIVAKYTSQLNKVENICKTAENTLNNLLYDMVNQAKSDEPKKKGLKDRFNRRTKICNIFLESSIKVSMQRSLDDYYHFLKKYYAILPFHGLWDSRLLNLSDQYVLFQQSEQRKLMDLPQVQELEDRLYELVGDNTTSSRSSYSKQIQRQRTLVNQRSQFQRKRTFMTQKTISQEAQFLTEQEDRFQLPKDIGDGIKDTRQIVKESIVFLNKQYHNSQKQVFNLNPRHRHLPGQVRPLNLIYKWYQPYTSLKLAPLIRIEIISQKRFVILKRTLMTPKLLRPHKHKKVTIQEKDKVVDEEEDEEDKEIRKQEEKLKKKQDIINTTLFGKKKEMKAINTFTNTPKTQGDGQFTISVGELQVDDEQQNKVHGMKDQKQLDQLQESPYDDDTKYEETDPNNILDNPDLFLVQKVKKASVQEIFDLICKERYEVKEQEYELVEEEFSPRGSEPGTVYQHYQESMDARNGQDDGAFNEQETKEPDTFIDQSIKLYFPWYDESDFKNKAIFFKPSLEDVEQSQERMLFEPLTKIQDVAVIKASEIIEDPFVKQPEDLLTYMASDIQRLKQEQASVFCQALIGPIALLGILRQYDYLILYRELDYIQNLEALAEQDELETLYEEFRLLKHDEYEIDLRFPNEMNFGLIVVDIAHLKKEMISNASMLTNTISEMIKKKFLKQQEEAWLKYEEVKKRLQQPIETKEVFILLKKYITNNELEQDQEVLNQYLKTCKRLEAQMYKFRVYLTENQYAQYWLSFEWQWRIKQIKEETQVRMNRCIEKFKQEVIKEADMIKNQIQQLGRVINYRFKYCQDMENAESYATHISEIVEKLKHFQEKATQINDQEDILGLALTDYSEIQLYLNTGRPLKTLWKLVKNWHNENEKYLIMSFSDLNKNEIEQTVKNAYETIDRLEEKLNFEDTDNPRIVLERVGKELDEFCESCMPVIAGLLSEKIRQRHWNELRDHLYATQINANPNNNLDNDLNAPPQLKASEITLKYLLEENIISLIPVIQQIREKAEKEFENEIYIENLNQQIRNYSVDFINTKEGNILIKNARDHANALQDYNFNSKIKLKNDIYILPFEEHLKELQFKLKTMKHYMEQVDRVQKNYIILSDAYRLKEIQSYLSKQWLEFQEIDKEFYEKMKSNSKILNFLQSVTEEDYLKLRLFNEKLKGIRLAFRHYFSEKREQFPRFFFLSDQQLMNLICSQNNPKQINTYLGYCFRGIKQLVLDDKKDMILGCKGIKNESVTFQEPIIIRTAIRSSHRESFSDDERRDGGSDKNDNDDQDKVNVDICEWMMNLEYQMRWSLKNIFRRCIIERDDHHLEEWLYNESFNEQTYLVVEAIKFNYDVANVFQTDGLEGIKKYLKKVRRYAKAIINFIQFDDIWLEQQPQDSDKSNNKTEQGEKISSAPKRFVLRLVKKKPKLLVQTPQQNTQSTNIINSRRLIFESLYLQKLHQIEILEILLQNQCQDLTCFEWLSHLKFRIEIEQHRLDDNTNKINSQLQMLKQSQTLLEKLSKQDIQKLSRQQKIIKEVTEEDDILTPGGIQQQMVAESQNTISLGLAVRRRIRMEVEAQALKAEQEKDNIETIKQLSKLYSNILDDNSQQLDDIYFEYSPDYKALKREKKDFQIYAYLLGFYQQYGFEFNPTEGSELVNTPLTQKCMYNLFSAVCQHMGGLINGGTGVGKTETIKSLARSLAKPFIQWSCRGGTSYNGLSRIFAGMAISGCWLCLDEINQLEIQVLSTLIQQVLNIKHAVYLHKSIIEVNLSGGSTEVPFNSDFGLFATYTQNESIPLNKVVFRESKQIYGLSFNNFPHILFENFRVVYMVIPDTRIIITCKLLMLGFNNALNLSNKIVTCLQLLSENMIPYHMKNADKKVPMVSFPLSLRNIDLLIHKLKYILRTFTFKEDVTEDYIIANALRGTFVYSLDESQKEIFDGIISNIFNTSFNDILAYSLPQEDRMGEVINNLIQEYKLSYSEQIVTKTKQLLSCMGATIKNKEIRRQEHSSAVILVGRAMSGKTELIQLAAQAFFKIKNKQFNLHRINVDSCSQEILFGFCNSQNVWQDGVLTSLLLKCLTKVSKDQQKFLSEDSHKSTQIGLKEQEFMKASTNPDQFSTTNIKQSTTSQQLNRSGHTLKGKKTLKRSKNLKESFFLQEEKGLLASQRDWIVLDGKVEESFSTNIHYNWFERFLTLVEEESQFLNLTNGDTIQTVNSDLQYIIETYSLKSISPSVMNRARIIYLDQDLIEDQVFFQKFLNTSFPPFLKQHNKLMLRLFDNIVSPILESIKENEKQVIPKQMLNFKINQHKLIIQDLITILNVLFDEFVKMCLCTKKIPRQRIEKSFQEKSSLGILDDSFIEKQQNDYNTNLFDNFQTKYSQRARKNQNLEQDQLTEQQEIQYIEALFMEGVKFMLSNYLLIQRHHQIIDQLIGILDELIHSKQIQNDFAFGLIDQLRQNQAIDNQDQSFLMNFYFDYTSQQWKPFNLINPYLEKCTNSGRYEYGKRKFSFTEEFRLNDKYRQSKGNQLNSKEIERKFNQDFDSDNLEYVYVAKTSHQKRNIYYLKLLQSYSRNIMITGNSQTGKSHLVQSKIHSDMKFKDFRGTNIHRYIPFIMNSLTKVNDLKKIVESNMEVQRLGVYVPPSKHSTYLFIDDLNIASMNPDKDSASPTELLREFFELGGWYSRLNIRFNYIQQLSIIANYTTTNQNNDNPQHTFIKGVNERVHRHFTKMHLLDLSKNEIRSIFKAYIYQKYDKKHNKVLIDISKVVVDALAHFFEKNMFKMYYDSKLYGINISLTSTIQMIRKFVQFNFQAKDKLIILKVWFDIIKKQFLYQFPVVFSSQEEKRQFNDRLFDNKLQSQKSQDQNRSQDSFISEEKILSDSSCESDQSDINANKGESAKRKKESGNISRSRPEVAPSNQSQSDRIFASYNDQSEYNTQDKKGKFSSYNNMIRSYIDKINILMSNIANSFIEEKPSKKNEHNSGITLTEMEQLILRKVLVGNSDIFERHIDLNKSYDYEYSIFEDQDAKRIGKLVRKCITKFVTQDDNNFKNEFLRMDDSQYDKYVKHIVDLCRQLEEPRSHIVLKGSYDIDCNFLSFTCKIVSQVLRYTPYYVNISQPEFQFSDFLKDFNTKIEENIYRKNNNMILIVELENYNLSHQLNDEHRQQSISQFLFFLQALSTGSRFPNLLNYQEMKINLDKIRLREYAQQQYDYENYNEEQIVYSLHSDLRRHIRIIFTTNHSRGSFMLDQNFLHSFQIQDDAINNYDQITLETFGYLASYCGNLFSMARIINVDLLHYHEENLFSLQLKAQSKTSMGTKPQDKLFIQALNSVNSNENEQENHSDKVNKMNQKYFKNDFRINDQKYDRIIESAYVTARKIQNIMNDMSQWEVDSSLEQDKQLVYFIFERLMTRYYKKHYQKKRDTLDYLSWMKMLKEELDKIKEESKTFKTKKEKLKQDRIDSKNTIEDNKRQIESNKKKSGELLKKSTETLNQLYKERRFKQIELDHQEKRFIEEFENLKKTQETEYEEFLQSVRNGKGPTLLISHNLCLIFILIFGTEKLKKKAGVKIDKQAPKFFLQKYTYQKFIEDLNDFSLQKKFASDNIAKLQQLYEEAVDMLPKVTKQLSKFQRLSLSWFINAINYSKMKAEIDEIQIQFERDIMEAEDQRSRAVNLKYINQLRLEEIQILENFSKKLEKKIRKLNNSVGNLKDLSNQLKDIKKDLSGYAKKWKNKLLDQAAPFDMTEGNMLYIALYFVFVMRFPSQVSAYLREYILNLMLEWDLKFNISNAIFQFVNLETKDFAEECSLFGIEDNQRLFENLALIKLINKFKLPFPFIYDPLGIAFKYISQMEAGHGVEVEMITITETEDLDQENLKNVENRIFQFYEERQNHYETTFERIVRCMENGTPIIFKDVDVKALRLIDSLIQWRFKQYLKEAKNYYFGLNKHRSQFDQNNDYDDASDSPIKSQKSNNNLDNSVSQSDNESLSRFLSDQKRKSQEHEETEDDMDTIHFNKAFVTIKKTFRIYLIFSNKDFQNLENYYRQRTTFINLAVEDDQEMMKDVILDILMIQQESLKREKQFLEQFRSWSVQFRKQEQINEVKASLKSLRETQQQKLKFVLENKYLKKYRALFEKVQKEMQDEELKDEINSQRPGEAGGSQKHPRPLSEDKINAHVPSSAKGMTRKFKAKAKNTSFGSDNLLQFFLKSPHQIHNKEAFDKLYKEILESNYKQKQDFKNKIKFATEPIYLLWKTTQDVRSSIGTLYNYTDNFFKLLIQQTVQELFQLSVTFSHSSSRKEVSNITENLILRIMHKLMGGLRKDHKVTFMFIFCLKILEQDEERLQPVKHMISEKINFLFNGLQIYQGDLLAINYEPKDFRRNPKWDYTKHKLQDTYNTIEGKILPLASHVDIKKANDLLKSANLGFQISDLSAYDTLELQKDLDLRNGGDQSPEIKMQNIRKIEARTQKVVKMIGGHIYREFQVQSLITSEKKNQIYKDELDSGGKKTRRGSRLVQKIPSELNLELQELKVKAQDSTNQLPSLQSQSSQSERVGAKIEEVLEVQKRNERFSQTREPEYQKRASILGKNFLADDEKGNVHQALRRRSTISEGMMKRGSQSSNSLRNLLPEYHFDALTALISNFFDSFSQLENEIMKDKEKWLEMFFETPKSQDFDPFSYIPKPTPNQGNKKDHQQRQQFLSDPVDKLLLLFVSKSETVAKAIDGLINYALDPIFHYLPKHSIEIHATLEWFKRPTLVFYTFGSPNPAQRIINAGKKAFRQVIRVSCGKSNFNVLKSKILAAARGGTWLIIENIEMLPEDQMLKILKFFNDRIIHVRQSFPNLRIWITYYISSHIDEEYVPLNAKQSLQTKFFQLTNDCFKIFLNEKDGLKQHMMTLLEPDLGYILHDFEEHFYSVLLPKDPSHDRDSKVKLEGKYWQELIVQNVDLQKRKDIGQNKIQKFQKRFNQTLSNELSFTYKTLMMISILQEHLKFIKDQNREFNNNKQLVFAEDDTKQFIHFNMFFLYFLNKKKDFSFDFLQKSIIEYFGINDPQFKSFSPSILKNLFSFLTKDVGNYSIESGRKHYYYMFGKEHHDVDLSIQDVKKNIKMMPESDSLAIVGASLNQGLVKLYNETKDILKGLSMHFSRVKINKGQENRLKTLFNADRDQLTLDNRDLLLKGFSRELDSFNDRMYNFRQKMLSKEDYCFGDIDKIVELYLNQFDKKNLDELSGFNLKLQNLLNQRPTTQKYILYKSNQFAEQPSSMAYNTKQPEDNTLHVPNKRNHIGSEIFRENISDINSPLSNQSKPVMRNNPLSSGKYTNKSVGGNSAQLKKTFTNELSCLKKLYYDNVQSKETQIEKVFNTLSTINELMPELLVPPEFQLKLQLNQKSFDEEQSADEEEHQFQQQKNHFVLKRQTSNSNLKNSSRQVRSSSISNQATTTKKETEKIQLPFGQQSTLTVQSKQKMAPPRLNVLIPSKTQKEHLLGSGKGPVEPASASLYKISKLALVPQFESESNKQLAKQQITQSLSDLDYNYKYKFYTNKNELIFKNFFILELQIMNNILRTIRRDLTQLKDYIGKRQRSIDYHDLDLYKCLLKNEVPGKWLKEGFFCKINVTLVEWIELLTSKYAYLERWVIEQKGTPPPVLKAAVLMNPINLFKMMLSEYSNSYGLPFNNLGLVIYFCNQKPISQQQSQGIFFEGITLKNGHLNPVTGELEKALIREFEHEIPLMKIRVQCVRSQSLDCAESIPILVRTKKLTQHLARFKDNNSAKFTKQSQNFAQTILSMIDKFQKEQQVPLEPASPLKVERGKRPMIKDVISDVAQNKIEKSENMIKLTFQTMPRVAQSPQIRPSHKQGLQQMSLFKDQIKPKNVVLQPPKTNKTSQFLKIMESDRNNKTQVDTVRSSEQRNVQPTRSTGLFKLVEMEGEDSHSDKEEKKEQQRQISNNEQIPLDRKIGMPEINVVATEESKGLKTEENEEDDSDGYYSNIFLEFNKEHMFAQNGNLKQQEGNTIKREILDENTTPSNKRQNPQIETEKEIPKTKQVTIFENELDENSEERYEIICPLICTMASNNLFQLKFHFRFKSRYSQAYWNSVGLVAYFNSIKKL